MAYKTMNLLLTIVPLIFSVFFIINLIIKFYRNKKNKESQKETEKLIYWELPAIIIALFFSVSSYNVEVYQNFFSNEILKIENKINNFQHIITEKNPSIHAINVIIENKIEDARRNHKHILLLRTFNLPNPKVGKEDDQDFVIGKRFLGAAFSFEYFICYSSTLKSSLGHNIFSRSNQMQIFLFDQLTQSIWKEFDGFNDRYKIHYIPYTKDYNSWSVSSANNDDIEGGHMYFVGKWEGTSINPYRTTHIIANNSDLKIIIKEDILSLKNVAEDFYKAQLNLPVYHREPCMIFYSHNPTPSLRPISKDELFKRIDQWVSQWTYESKNISSVSLKKPDSIIQLELLKKVLSE